MILDILPNAWRYEALHPAFTSAFAFLRNPDLMDLRPGRHNVGGPGLWASVNDGPGRDPGDAMLEAHRAHIDIQLVLDGVDRIGWRPLGQCAHPLAPHDPTRDVRFWRDEPICWVTVEPGAFAIFFPEDAHLPMIGPDPRRKVVLKVATATGL
ncbi:MAG: YhcH/YjgK/YiaL family protein [Desulfovibrionaceae bacterium]